MTAKEYLMQYRDAMRRSKAIADHLTELRAMCEQLRTEDGHKIELDKAVAELVDAQNRAKLEVDRLTALEQEIVQTISHTDEPYRTILYERYINGKTWEQVAVEMHYTYRRVIQLHGDALRTVAEILNNPSA